MVFALHPFEKPVGKNGHFRSGHIGVSDLSSGHLEDQKLLMIASSGPELQETKILIFCRPFGPGKPSSQVVKKFNNGFCYLYDWFWYLYNIKDENLG